MGRPPGSKSLNPHQQLTIAERTRLLNAIAPFVLAASNPDIPEREVLRIAREFIKERRKVAAA